MTNLQIIHVQFSENTTLIKLNIDTKSKDLALKPSSDDGVEETLLSIPNRTVKLYSANGTAREAVWESRTLPGQKLRIFSSVG